MGKISIKVNFDTSSGLQDKEFVLNVDDKLEQHIKERMSTQINLLKSNSLKNLVNAYLNECFENIVKDKMIENILEKLEEKEK
jgi:hypothetical protein